MIYGPDDKPIQAPLRPSEIQMREYITKKSLELLVDRMRFPSFGRYLVDERGNEIRSRSVTVGETIHVPTPLRWTVPIQNSELDG